MKRTLFIPAFLLGGLFLVACNDASTTSETTNTTDSTAQEMEPLMDEEEVDAELPNKDSLITVIDERRKEIEASLGEPTIISTENLKENIKQKWNKIHFYTLNDEVVRIKTYPYAEITNRTEEFYFMDSQLVLAIIEDNGAGERGKMAEELDKIYYFYNESVIDEKTNSTEKEYGIRNSDAEELVEEVKEYLDILNSANAE